MIARRPSILIPIPWSYLNEQFKNAELAVNFGIAKIINQKDLSGKILEQEIAVLIKNWEDMISKVKDKESLDKNASKKVVDVIKNYLR
jgi:UDP-N-acetylglucosamine:LPS N-acetylglucosamine transferase